MPPAGEVGNFGRRGGPESAHPQGPPRVEGFPSLSAGRTGGLQGILLSALFPLTLAEPAIDSEGATGLRKYLPCRGPRLHVGILKINNCDIL